MLNLLLMFAVICLCYILLLIVDRGLSATVLVKPEVSKERNGME
jgi:hypothetical protein